MKDGTSGRAGKAPRPDRVIRWTTTAAVALLAGIAAVVSYGHMHELAIRHGEDPWAAALVPLSVDGMIIASSMSILYASRHGRRGSPLAWTLLIVGSLASLGANVAVADPSLIARIVAAWPSFALIGAYETLMGLIRQTREVQSSTGKRVSEVHHATTSEHEPPPSEDGPDRSVRERVRDLRCSAWRWAQANCAQDGSLPSGRVIAQAFNRSARWGRMIKKAGITGTLG
ncbi:DUF2637 domain-containing protein [Nonomuraea sp. M3C6]|uniref:DUF2637 domain-containing protein n=1 Tax=Nonomuraea marmarensis TaxID=3351344 RepID=A0ABW7AN25_9ACTN